MLDLGIFSHDIGHFDILLLFILTCFRIRDDAVAIVISDAGILEGRTAGKTKTENGKNWEVFKLHLSVLFVCVFSREGDLF